MQRKEKNTPRVSVLMANYNDERFLGAAIASILSQSLTAFELIVVDDGSSDQSVSLLKVYAKKDKRIRVFYFPKNRGFARALNYGLKFARGEYVARMDSDDFCHPDRLKKQVSYLDKHAEIHALGCRYRAINEEGFFCSFAYAKSLKKPLPIVFGRHRVAKAVFRFRYPVLHPTIVCRRSTFLSVGGYREFLPISEDDDLYCRLVSLHGGVLDNLPEKLYYYRHYSSSTTQRFSYPFRMLVIFLISLSSEFRRRGFWDPLEERPSLDSRGLRFRGISSLLFLQDSLVFLPSYPREGLYSLLRIVTILRRFGLKNFHHISLWSDLGISFDKQVYFYTLFGAACFRLKKFRSGFLYCRYVFGFFHRVSLPTMFFILFKIFTLVKHYSHDDKYYYHDHLQFFYSLIFTTRWHYGLKHLLQAWHYGLKHLFQPFFFPFYCLFPSRLVFPVSPIRSLVMSPPRISVVMTAYNSERFLGASIESILDQSFTDLELIVVDDGSTDSSASIIRSFSARDSRVRGIFLDRNLGIPKAANHGLRAARGEYVARMDSDDRCHRERLLTQVSYLDKHQEVQVVGCHYRAVDEEGFFYSSASAGLFKELIPISFGRDRVAENILRCRYPILHATIVCRRSTLLSVGGYREFLPMSEDDDLYCRLVSLHGGVLDNLPEKLYYYRYYSSSTTQRFSYPLRMLIIFLISLSSEFRRRGFWDPLEERPSLDSRGLRFRGVSSLLFLQDSLVFLPSYPREGLYSLLRIVTILRRFGLKNFHHISLWSDLGISFDKQVYFYTLFGAACFRLKKFRSGFLYCRYVFGFFHRVSPPTMFFILFKIFTLVKHYSHDDKYYYHDHLQFFYSLIFTTRWNYGLKHLLQAWHYGLKHLFQPFFFPFYCLFPSRLVFPVSPIRSLVMSPPRISVVMTAYNSERFLGASIESILDQSFTDLELIVVDDGSTDSSASIIRSFSARDSRVRGIFLDRNLGIPKAANHGLRAARGEYVARMDSDDRCHRERLLTQVSYLDKHQEVQVVGCHYRAVDEEGFFYSSASAGLFKELIPISFGRDRVAENILRCRYPILHATIVCRRSTLLSVGGYREFLPMSEDDDLYCRLVSLHGGVLDNLPEKLYYYRYYSSSTTQRFSYPLRMLIIFLISLSSEFRRRGFWDPLEERPSLDSRGLRFRGVSSLLFLQDSLVFLPSYPREGLYSLLRIVTILRRFGLKNFHHISLWSDLGISFDKQVYFYTLFGAACFRLKKFRSGFLYCRYVFGFFHRVSPPTMFFILFKIFTLVKHYSHDDKYYYHDHLQFFYSLIFTTRWNYGLKHLLQAWHYGLKHLFQPFFFPFYCLFPSRLVFPVSPIRSLVMSPPRISVVMTAYNSERFLGASIESILDQSFTDLELIVVDDGSTDSSASIIRSFSARDSRVRGIFLDRNLGIPKAANHGLRAARGEYVARMDSDDRCHRERLLTQVSYLDKHQEVHVVGCHYRAVDEEGFFYSSASAGLFKELIPISFGRDRVAENILRCRYPILHATIVCRRSTLLSVGGYREFLPMSEDDDLYCRLVSLHGGVLDNLPEKLYYYRYYSSSTTQRFSYPLRMLIIFLISLSSEFRRRGFWDPLEERPSLDSRGLRFRGVSSLLFLQDSLVFLPSYPREGLYSLLRVVVILRRFGLKNFQSHFVLG